VPHAKYYDISTSQRDSNTGCRIQKIPDNLSLIRIPQKFLNEIQKRYGGQIVRKIKYSATESKGG
jgi:hypothetical protein